MPDERCLPADEEVLEAEDNEDLCVMKPVSLPQSGFMLLCFCIVVVVGIRPKLSSVSHLHISHICCCDRIFLKRCRLYKVVIIYWCLLISNEPSQVVKNRFGWCTSCFRLGYFKTYQRPICDEFIYIETMLCGHVFKQRMDL